MYPVGTMLEDWIRWTVLAEAIIEVRRAGAEPEMIFPNRNRRRPQTEAHVLDLSGNVDPLPPIRADIGLPDKGGKDENQRPEDNQGALAIITLLPEPGKKHGQAHRRRQPAAARNCRGKPCEDGQRRVA